MGIHFLDLIMKKKNNLEVNPKGHINDNQDDNKRPIRLPHKNKHQYTETLKTLRKTRQGKPSEVTCPSPVLNFYGCSYFSSQ